MKICPVCKNDFEGGEVFCPNDGARLQTPSQMAGPSDSAVDPLVGEVLAERYRILRRIGEGGMGIVYEAEHVVIEKRVALKVLRDDFSSRPEVTQRFRQEAKSASRIGNEHIVDISDFGETPSGASYFVMELLDGEDLANVLSAHGTIGFERACDILLQCTRALSAAHSKGIVHRDMKPENIFLTQRGDGRTDFVKIVDFGIAKMSDIETPGEPGRKLTKTGMIFGTPEYMSPEQAAGKPLDHRVDTYALGVIFFEMLTGRVPFVGDTFMGILTQHMFEEPPRLKAVNPNVEVDPAVENFIAKALAKAADDRFQSCDEMQRALEQLRAGEFVAGGTFVGYGEPVKYKPKQPRAANPEAATAEFPSAASKRSPVLMIGGLLGALGFAALVGGGVYVAMNDPDTGATTPDVASLQTDAGTTLMAAAPPDAGSPPPPEQAPDAGPTTVAVRVVTSPPGARVWVVDHGDVCMETPCSFDAQIGTPIVVRARRGRAEGEVELTPSIETELTVPLVTPRRPAGGGGHAKDPGTGTSGGGGGDLKIPEVFRRPRLH